MRTTLLLFSLLAVLTGCQARGGATRAAAPKMIHALSNQTLVYSCPACGMDYDSPGKCTMCDVDLVKTEVAYICPADDKPVEHAGACPRCNVNARVVKTAAAVEQPAAPAVPAAGSTNGS